MQLRKSGLIVLAASLTIGLAPGFGQASAKQDMKNAGTETKDATKDVGHGIAKGSKKAYHSTAHGQPRRAERDWQRPPPRDVVSRESRRCAYTKRLLWSPSMPPPRGSGWHP